MRPLHAPWRRFLPPSLLAVLPLLLLAACTGDGSKYPQSTLHPKGDFAVMVDDLFDMTVYLATFVFVVVEAALLWAIVKFRGKPDDPEPKQVHGSTVVEIIWTVVPALVLAVVAVPTVRAIFDTAKVPDSSPDGSKPLQIEVIGHQWWWEFRYPEYGIATAGDLHVPKGRTVDLRMKTADVLHAFWVPQFSGKRDVFPNRETRLWFTANATGAFPGACTEFCGTQHGRMDFYTVVSEPADFDAWVATRRADSLLDISGLAPKAVAAAPAPAADGKAPTAADSAAIRAPVVDAVELAGRAAFKSGGCIACHTLNSTFLFTSGPNLSGIGARTMIAAGWLENTDENLRKWLSNPDSVKRGVKMELPRPLTSAELDALVAYLRTKR